LRVNDLEKRMNFAACLLKAVVLSIAVACATVTTAAHALELKGFNLTQKEPHIYDANLEENAAKTEAQEAVDALYDLGVRHIVLIPEARMESGTSTEVIPVTPIGGERAKERQRYIRLIRYIKAKGMTAGLRPLLLVDPSPGSGYWQGNIRPEIPTAWFESYLAYLTIYANIAKASGADEFTIGAELHSMTIGLEDQWAEQPYGFPREWTILAREIKAKLGAETRLTYDIFCSDSYGEDKKDGASGGEFERWRYRLVSLKPANETDIGLSAEAWRQLREFWSVLDAVGIDMFRPMVLNTSDALPANQAELTAILVKRAEGFAKDLNNKIQDIEKATGISHPFILKAVGFKSCTECLANPFASGPTALPSALHQAAAYESLLTAFTKPGFSWLKGIYFWDMPIDPARAGSEDTGFSPRLKEPTENVLRKFFLE